ncbi:MAG: M20/M25/M40 family metallo-hydrolase [Planctomycetaceae bacterium]|jgi:acetylornithine deacetylase|nr:M20/M25/M40 family metallo-hydrolase [Planctomycetaceae bacterium]MBT6487076.1 M20/M25/M40 family metallo-hydrolase [Planctomycetaceae bacterium]
MPIDDAIVEQVRAAVQTDRLLDTAMRLIEVPSPTCSGAAVADRMAEILTDDGFTVERPEAGWPESPAVAVRFHAESSGRTIQFNGHLDTVHLPFVPPRVEEGVLYGSGSSDMKGGIAAMIEALRALRDSGTLPAGSVLLTAHDLHEAPWGDGSQVDRLIDAGFVGDGVLLPEYLCDRLPVIGRGLAVLSVKVSRRGEPVHEVLGGSEQPSVIRAGADIVLRFEKLDDELARKTHPLAGRESLFIGQIQAGEIFNQSPIVLELAGTRRWLPGTSADDARKQFHEILAEIAEQRGVEIEGDFRFVRDAYEISETDPLAEAFQDAYSAVDGQPLTVGAKPFVDDGNTFVHRGGIPAVTHGPNATGAHTVHEEVPVEELVRVANVYALTAIQYCGE